MIDYRRSVSRIVDLSGLELVDGGAQIVEGLVGSLDFLHPA
jgi:hypothetical protein